MAETNKKIYYIGPLGKGSTTLQRMESLQELGHDIVSFDMDPYYQYGSRLLRAISYRLNYGPQIGALNRDIVSRARDLHCDYVWIDKGIWIYPETVEALKKRVRAVIHYTPDPAIVFHQTRHFIRSIPCYDIVITTKRYEMDLYPELGAREVIYADQGYDANIFRPHDVEPELQSRLETDVIFVGHCEPHYYRYVRCASEVTRNTGVWGKWDRHVWFHPWLKSVYRGSGIWHVDYAKAICCSKVGLGLLSKLAPDQTTTRTYEITACGTFMLAERTEEHVSLFAEGKEADFFASEEEFKDKLNYYLSHDLIRERIAKAGRERCIQSGYSYTERMRGVLAKIADLVN